MNGRRLIIVFAQSQLLNRDREDREIVDGFLRGKCESEDICV
jgi:hypothetical protein